MAVQSGVYRGVNAEERTAARRARLLDAALAVWADQDTRTTMTAVSTAAGLLFIGGTAELVTAWLDGASTASADEIVDATTRALLGRYR